MSDQFDRSHHLPSDHVPPGAPPWVSRELIEHTLRIWQPFYIAPLMPEDALEIIMSADRMFELVSRGFKGETVRRTGTRQQP